jgi:hypothetical protein
MFLEPRFKRLLQYFAATNQGILYTYLQSPIRPVIRKQMESNLPGLHLTPEQLFFVSFGRTWCSQMRPECLLTKRTSIETLIGKSFTIFAKVM